MGMARLEVLDLNLPLRGNQEYHDEGFVNSMITSVEELSNRYQDDQYISELYARQLLDADIPKGGCLTFHSGLWIFKREYIHILYENQNNIVLNTNTRAHEEFHALEKIPRGRRVLEDRMKQEGFELSMPFFFVTKERGAKIIGLYTLLKRGISLEEIRETLPEHLTKELEFFYYVKNSKPHDLSCGRS